MNIFLKNHTIPLKLNTLLQHCSLSENLFYSFEDGWIGGCEESMAWWKLQSCRWKLWPFNRRWRKRERQKDVLAENGTKLVFKNQEPSWHSHLSLDHSRRKKHSWLQRMEIHQPQQGLVWSGWLVWMTPRLAWVREDYLGRSSGSSESAQVIYDHVEPVEENECLGIWHHSKFWHGS